MKNHSVVVDKVMESGSNLASSPEHAYPLAGRAFEGEAGLALLRPGSAECDSSPPRAPRGR